MTVTTTMTRQPSKTETNEALCARAQQGDKQAELVLLAQNQGLIHELVWRERRKYFYLQVEHEDLVAAGQVGLLRAMRRYRPADGAAFVTYAWHHIRQAIQREIIYGGTMIRFPVYLHDQMHKVGLYQNGRQQGDAETVAQQMQEAEPPHLVLSPQQIQACLSISAAATQFRSLNETVGHDDTLTRDETIADPGAPAPDRVAEARLMVEMFLSRLTPRERQVICLRYGLEDEEKHTLLEVGESMGISKERARQLEKSAMEKMRKAV